MDESRNLDLVVTSWSSKSTFFGGLLVDIGAASGIEDGKVERAGGLD